MPNIALIQTEEGHWKIVCESPAPVSPPPPPSPPPDLVHAWFVVPFSETLPEATGVEFVTPEVHFSDDPPIMASPPALAPPSPSPPSISLSPLILDLEAPRPASLVGKKVTGVLFVGTPVGALIDRARQQGVTLYELACSNGQQVLIQR